MNVITPINSNNPFLKKNHNGNNAIAQFVLPFLADVHPFALTSKVSLSYVKKQVVEEVRKELLKINFESNIAVPLFLPLPQFPEALNFGAYHIKTVRLIREANFDQFRAEICDDKEELHPKVNYRMRYFAQGTGASKGKDYPAKRLELHYSFRADLPIKVAPGIPTTLAIHHRILQQIAKAGINLQGITNLSADSVDAQTVIDYFHGRIVKGYSPTEAFAHCHTSRLIRDLGAMVGASEVRLTYAQSSGMLQLMTLLTYSSLPEDQIAAFKVQPKIRELQAKTCGMFSVDNPNLIIPCTINLRFTVERI